MEPSDDDSVQEAAANDIMEHSKQEDANNDDEIDLHSSSQSPESEAAPAAPSTNSGSTHEEDANSEAFDDGIVGEIGELTTTAPAPAKRKGKKNIADRGATAMPKWRGTGLEGKNRHLCPTSLDGIRVNAD